LFNLPDNIEIIKDKKDTVQKTIIEYKLTFINFLNICYYYEILPSSE
jgi:hypothetical protein